jgi:GT2 family glycosyltransferase
VTAETGVLKEGLGTLPSRSTKLGISAVVVTFNSAHCVERCLASVTRQLRPAEIIVVDNASDDDSVEAARRAAPDAVVIESDVNLGFGRACNRGVARARGDIIAFVNPDVVISRADREDLEAALSEPLLGLLVPLLSELPSGTARHQIFRYRPWLRAVLSQTWSPLRPRELHRSDRRAASAENAWAAAALLFVRKDEFIDLGGFDSRYFLYAEDLDLSRRYRDRGLTVRLTDSVVGHHSGAASSTSADSLRIAPHGWSILGTLEYLSLWEGDRVAARAAETVVYSFRVQLRLLHGLMRVPGLRDRATRKQKQIEQLAEFVYAHSHATAEDGTGASSYCPGARVALSSAFRGAPSP